MVENFAMLHYSLLQRAPPENHCVLMAASLKLLPGSTVRWRGRRYLIVDYQSLDAIIARQSGKRRLERIPVNEAAPDHASHIVSGGTPDLVSVPEKAWQTAVKRFEILKPLLNMRNSERTPPGLSSLADVFARRNRSKCMAAGQRRSSPFSSRLERNALVR